MYNSLKFSHFGIAVSDFNKAKNFFFCTGYQISESVIDENQNILATLIKHENQSDIEIISKINQDDITPIDKLIKNNMSLIYHICFFCKNINSFIDESQDKNNSLREIVKPIYSPLFKKEISFFITESIGLVEIIHERC